MSDFLKNLRSPHRGGQAKHSTITRKDMNGNFFPGDDRRKHKDRRISRTMRDEKAKASSHIMDETIPAIKDNLDRMTSYLEKMAGYQESLVEAKIKQCRSMEIFFKNMNHIVNDINQMLTCKNGEIISSSDESRGYASNAHYSKEDVISMIKSMRSERATFAEIAEKLKEKGIPTFSGRGEWHAQTIHRLCKTG